MKPGSYFECLNNNCDKLLHCFLVNRGLAGLRKTTKRRKKNKKNPEEMDFKSKKEAFGRDY